MNKVTQKRNKREIFEYFFLIAQYIIKFQFQMLWGLHLCPDRIFCALLAFVSTLLLSTECNYECQSLG